MHKVIVNSTPLIALSSINQLEILKNLYGEVTIPQAVYDEISAKEKSICKQEVENSLEWINVEQIKDYLAKTMFKTQLHDGEVEVMVLAKEKEADIVIIDDKNAKKHAKYLGLNVTGTLGVLLKAKKCGIIDEVKPLVEQLVKNHIYISEKVIEICLKQAGEF